MFRGFLPQRSRRVACALHAGLALTVAPAAAGECPVLALVPAGERQAGFVQAVQDSEAERLESEPAAVDERNVRREAGDEPGRRFTIAFELPLLCTPAWPALRFDVGVLHDDSAAGAGVARLSAVQRIPIGTWYASAERSSRTGETRYSAALYLLDTPQPVVLEASRRRRDDGWITWLTGGMYLISGENYELGIAFSDGGGLAAGRRHAMLNFTAEF